MASHKLVDKSVHSLPIYLWLKLVTVRKYTAYTAYFFRLFVWHSEFKHAVPGVWRHARTWWDFNWSDTDCNETENSQCRSCLETAKTPSMKCGIPDWNIILDVKIRRIHLFGPWIPSNFTRPNLLEMAWSFCLMCNDPRAAGTPDRVVTDLLVMEKSEECSGCRRYLGYLNHEKTNIYNYRFNN